MQKGGLMSGGSYQYAYSRLENDFLSEFLRRANTPERREFAAHIRKVIKAMHDIEWVDSGDYAPGDEKAAIMECIDKVELLERHIEEAKQASEILENLLEQSKKQREEQQ